MKKIKKPIAIRFGLENVECIDFQIDAFKTFSICENALCHWYYEGKHEINDSFGGGYFRIKKEFNYKLEGEYYNENSITTAFDRLMQFNDIIGITIYYPNKKVEICPWIEDEEYFYTYAAGNTDQHCAIDKETGDLLIWLNGLIISDSEGENIKKQKDTFDIDDEEYLEEYCIKPDDVEDYDDEEDESAHNLVIDTSRFNQPDGCLLPDDDVEDYKITDFLIF